MGFNVEIDLQKYVGIFPNVPSSADDIINGHTYSVNENYWQRQTFKRSIPNTDELLLENIRLKQGTFIRIKDDVFWIPPPYYQFLQYGNAGGLVPEFRLKKLKEYYEKILVRNNPEAIGTYIIKNRQDGLTTSTMSDTLWEMGEGISLHGQFGVQSKTNEDAKNPCWHEVKSQWNGYPEWLKSLLYSDFDSGDNIETSLRFVRKKLEGLESRNLLFKHYPSVWNAMDGRNNMLKCILDEANKWKVASLLAAITCYKQFIMPGKRRKGMFDIISSPAEEDGPANDEAYQLYTDSNPAELEENGTTKSRIHRIISDPLDGIEGMYDKFGDVDPNEVYDHIMRERRTARPEKLKATIRAYALNEEERFGATESSDLWSNAAGIKKRKLYLVGTPFKDVVTQEPKYIWGNLDWENGIRDTTPVFRPNPKENLHDLNLGRFAFSETPQFAAPLDDIFTPPLYVESCLGIDPTNLRYEAKNKAKQSNFAAINLKFRKLGIPNFIPRPTMLYDCRHPHQEVMFEDMIKAMVYLRSLGQYENRNDKFANYAEDRGYDKWLLPEIGAAPDSKRKGDAPSGKGAFTNEGIFLIDALTNVPLDLNKGYALDHIWFEMLLEQILEFNPKLTKAFDEVMALIQALVGAAKISSMKVRQGHDILTSHMINYFMN